MKSTWSKLLNRKKIKRIKVPIIADIADCASKYHKCLFSSYSSLVLTIVPMSGLAGIGSL
jgi:hypothetical protein